MSPLASPVLFTGKVDSNIKPFFDYQFLDTLNDKNKYPLIACLMLENTPIYTFVTLKNEPKGRNRGKFIS